MQIILAKYLKNTQLRSFQQIMITAKDFEERYKNYSNAGLLEILESPAKYQIIAIHAARNELNSRNLLETEISEAKQQLETKKQACNIKKESTDLLISKVNKAADGIYDILNPINSSPAASKSITLITLVYGLLFFYSLIIQLDDIKALIGENSFDAIYFIIILLPLLVLLISLILFGFKKKDGWKLLLFFCSFSLIGIFYSLYRYITSLFKDNSYFIFAPPSPLAIILGFLFYAGTIFALSKADMMTVYKVNKQNISSYLTSGIIVGILYHLVSLYII